VNEQCWLPVAGQADNMGMLKITTAMCHVDTVGGLSAIDWTVKVLRSLSHSVATCQSRSNK